MVRQQTMRGRAGIWYAGEVRLGRWENSALPAYLLFTSEFGQDVLGPVNKPLRCGVWHRRFIHEILVGDAIGQTAYSLRRGTEASKHPLQTPVPAI